VLRRPHLKVFSRVDSCPFFRLQIEGLMRLLTQIVYLFRHHVASLLASKVQSFVLFKIPLEDRVHKIQIRKLHQSRVTIFRQRGLEIFCRWSRNTHPQKDSEIGVKCLSFGTYFIVQKVQELVLYPIISSRFCKLQISVPFIGLYTKSHTSHITYPNFCPRVTPISTDRNRVCQLYQLADSN